MKLIIDAQLPTKIFRIINQLGFDAIRVDELSEGDEISDKKITMFADRQDPIVVTKDYDFYHSEMALGNQKSFF